jgi:hypothetical protein
MPPMGRPSSWIFWLAGATTLAMALLGFWVTMRASDTNDVFWGPVCCCSQP